MEQILKLLKDKNHFLERFCLINDAEIINFETGNFENVEAFYATREQILETVKYIDQRVENVQEQFPEGVELPMTLRLEIESSFQRKNVLVNRIMSQDLRLLELLDSQKSLIIKELMTVHKSQKAMAGYKTSSDRSFRFDEEI